MPLFYDPRKTEIIELPHETVAPHPTPGEVFPLAELLTAKEFPYTRDDFQITGRRTWTEEMVRNVGLLVARELSEQSPPANFTTDVAERLNVLGVFPARNHFTGLKKFGGWSKFKKEIGFEHHNEKFDQTRNVAYDDLPLHEITTLLLNRYNDLFELPQGKRYEGPFTAKIIETLSNMNLAPSRNYFVRRYGGIHVLNEHLGFPDITSWDNHDYIDYGATILHYNGPGSITLKNIKILSANKFGPNWQAIQTRFDWNEFKELSQQELQRQELQKENHRNQVTSHYRSRVLHTPEDIAFSEMALHRALHMLCSHYYKKTPDLPDRIDAAYVRSTISDIVRKNPKITLAEIETTAVTMDIFDDLWPMNHKQRLPIIANCVRK